MLMVAGSSLMVVNVGMDGMELLMDFCRIWQLRINSFMIQRQLDIITLITVIIVTGTIFMELIPCRLALIDTGIGVWTSAKYV